MPTLFVDVSQHDWSRRGENMNWSRIKAATSAVCCIRATYGDPEGFSRRTLHFRDMADAARSAGFLVGAYHNLVRGDAASMVRQVDWLRREMDAVRAEWAMLDVERYEEMIAAQSWPRWGDVQRFQDRWQQVDGRVLLGYIPGWIWSGHIGQPDLRQWRGPLVASNYGENDSMPPRELYAHRGGDASSAWAGYGGRVPDIVQFGSRCTVAGASNITDINAFRGTAEQLTALLTGDDMPTLQEIRAVVRAEIEAQAGRAVWGHSIRRVVDDRRISAASMLRYTHKHAGAAASADPDPVDVDEEAIVAGVLAGLDLAALTDAMRKALSTLPKDTAREVVAQLASELPD